VLPAYVIHSPSLPERRDHIEGELRKAGIADFAWVTDFETSEITPQIDHQYFAAGAPLSLRQKSCALKHIVALQHIRDAGHDQALIFEDDAILGADFVQRLQGILIEAQNWPRPRILHLGAATNFCTPANRLRRGQSVYEGDRCRNMEAYVLGAPEASARLAWVARHLMDLPIDFVFNAGDKAMGIPFLWPEPPLAEQGSLTGAFKSSLSQKQHPQIQLRIQFAIQKFRRRYLKRWLERIAPSKAEREKR
jgi:glycosyl transferase, family 25